MLPIDPQDFIDLLPAMRQSPGHSMQCTDDEPADVVYVTFNPEAEATDSERLTGAALDRLTHRCHILETKGESYRLQDAKRRRRRAD